MTRKPLITAVVIAVSLMNLAGATYYVPVDEWNTYKVQFNKNYTNSDISESNAQYYYAYNKRMIERHNQLYILGFKTYRLNVNQFTDMPFESFSDLFPVTVSSGSSFDSPIPSLGPPAPSYDPMDFGIMSEIGDQGTKCNSGWAYAAAKSIELLKAQQSGNINPAPLSAQNLIDCAGRAAACKNQVPQAAFDYLTQYNMDLHLESDYKNNNTLNEQGMCIPRGKLVINLNKYSRIRDGDDETLKACISNGFPVVVEFNPTSFEFMHYTDGIFQQPTTRQGSHFMVVIGYGENETTGMDYWLLQNSFGTTWGDEGSMKLYRSSTTKLTKNAILPIELA